MASATHTRKSASAVAATAALNPIILENQKKGNPPSEWDMTNADNSGVVAQPSRVIPSLGATTATADAPAAPSPLPSSGAMPSSFSDVFGTPLNIWVPSEEPSPLTVTITGLPTTATVLLPDGITPVSVGESLSLAQLAGLRFKPAPTATATTGPQSSELEWNEGIPGWPSTPMSITIPADPAASTATSAPTATAATTTAAPNTTAVPNATADPPNTTADPPNTNAAPITMADMAAPNTMAAAAAPNTTATPANPNPIVLENEKPGATDWQIAPGQDSTEIEGFTTNISTPVGGTVQFKIDNETGNGNYQIKIYRLGYYGGDGATLVTTINHSGNPVVQPDPLVDPTTGATDAGNWSVTDSWAVPSNATSGVYVANVIDGSQIFQIPFIVTNPSSTSNIVFQTSDETWQAYNGFGGANLYGGDGPSNSGIDDGAAFA
ncbi:MAG: hypothetical protein JO110_16575, partial [Acetobacteraceae bacterium]|nr:hypothetical protein [Acetobacteraceae bacterium]